MPSPFPGMDPFLEDGPIFHEVHTQILAEAQGQLQPLLRPKYVARLERHLSEGAVWSLDVEVGSLEGKEPDIVVASGTPGERARGSTAVLPRPSVSKVEQLDPQHLELRKQRRIVIYFRSVPRAAVASIELLSPSNKHAGGPGRTRYLEKRSSALHGGLHWVEIDLLRGGERPPLPVPVPAGSDYLAYVAQATQTGWNHLVYSWGLRDAIPRIPIPLLGSDQVALDLGACFRAAYDRTAADEEADYSSDPPAPKFEATDAQWIDALLRDRGIRR